MVVRYSKKWAFWFIGLGIVCVVLYVGAPGLRHWGVVAAGAACLIVGVGYAFRPYFTVEKGRIVVHALLFPLKKTYEFEDGQLLQQGEKIWIYSGGAQRRVRISRDMTTYDDWTAFRRRAGLESSVGTTDSLTAPMWRFRLIGLDRYDYSYFTYGDFETLAEAEAEAVKEGADLDSMEDYFIYDDEGNRVR